MKNMNRVIVGGSFLFAVLTLGCGNAPEVNREASTSTIRAAEESGALNVPSASYYLQLAKEEAEKGKVLADHEKKSEAESMLRRAQVDGELAIALSRSDADKKEANDAIERVHQLRIDNKLPEERK